VSSFEDRLMAFYARADQEERDKKRVSVAVVQKRRESGLTQLQHVRAEKALNAKAEVREKMAEVERFRDALSSGIEAKALERLADVQQRRERIQLLKEEKHQRKQAQEAVREHVMKRGCIERVCRKEDEARFRQSQAAELQRTLELRRHEWAQRSRALAERHYASLQQRRRQVDELREQLQVLQLERQRQAEEQRRKPRKHMTKDASLARLIQAAQEHLDRYSLAMHQGYDVGMGGVSEEAYEGALKTFQDLTYKMADVDKPEEEDTVGPEEGALRHSRSRGAGGQPAASTTPPSAPRSRRVASEPPPPGEQRIGELPRKGPAALPEHLPKLPSGWSPPAVQLPALSGIAKSRVPVAPASARPDAKAWLRRISRQPLSAR